MWPLRRTKNTVGIAPTAASGTTIVESINAAGFDFAAIVDRGHAQASVGLVFPSSLVDTAMIANIEQSMAHLDGLVATTCILAGGARPTPARLWATFRARSKSQRRYDDEFVTDLARRFTELHTAALDAGADVTPLNASQAKKIATASWSDMQSPAWPPVAKTVEETISGVVIDGTAHMALAVDLGDDETSRQVTEAMTAIQVGAQVGLIRYFRPGMKDSAQGRVTGILTLSSIGTLADVQRVAAAVIDAFDPRVQLRTHVLYGRHQLAVAALCGGGLLGWQHLHLNTREVTA